MVKRIILTPLAAAALVFLGMQFDRPEKNLTNDQGKHLSTLFAIPDSVEVVLQTACYDCHSNKTRYPWYAEIQPVGQWMDGHIKAGKKDLNFSEFASYRPRRQFIKLGQIEELVTEGVMPLPSYTDMHADAILSGAQKQLLIRWTKALRDSLRIIHPPDSLASRRR